MKAHIFNRFTFSSLVLLFVFVFGCEGPAGEDGIAGTDGANGVDGVDGADGNVTCLGCHADGSIQDVNAQFVESVHSGGLVAVSYAGGRSYCAECHSHEGFLEFVATGDVSGDIIAPSAWECGTCHKIHETFDVAQDYALRKTDMTFIFDGSSPDFGTGNLCANCHQSRKLEPNTLAPGETFEITPHYGPHHGAQANVLYGAGLAEIQGDVDYPAAGSSTHFTGASCTGCHMGSYEGGTGGHTFYPGKNSCTTCHQSAVEGDFDYLSIQTDMIEQLNILRDSLISQGVIVQDDPIFELDPETGDIIEVLDSDGYHPVLAEFSMAQVQAYFNWVGILEDRSYGVHNPAYARALIANSLQGISQ